MKIQSPPQDGPTNGIFSQNFVESLAWKKINCEQACMDDFLVMNNSRNAHLFLLESWVGWIIFDGWLHGITFVWIGIAWLVIAIIGIGEFFIGRLIVVYAIGQIALIVFKTNKIVAAFGNLSLTRVGSAHIFEIASDEIVCADRFWIDAIEHNVVVFTFAFRQPVMKRPIRWGPSLQATRCHFWWRPWFTHNIGRIETDKATEHTRCAFGDNWFDRNWGGRFFWRILNWLDWLGVWIFHTETDSVKKYSISLRFWEFYFYFGVRKAVAVAKKAMEATLLNEWNVSNHETGFSQCFLLNFCSNILNNVGWKQINWPMFILSTVSSASGGRREEKFTCNIRMECIKSCDNRAHRGIRGSTHCVLLNFCSTDN